MRISALALLAVLVLAAAAPAGERSRTYAIPGDKVFPEGVAYDAANRAFYVGSTTRSWRKPPEPVRNVATSFLDGSA